MYNKILQFNYTKFFRYYVELSMNVILDFFLLGKKIMTLDKKKLDDIIQV